MKISKSPAIREQTRKRWQCDCEGAIPLGTPPTGGTKAQRDIWEHTYGEANAPDTCPWRCYDDPLICEVVEVYGDLGGYSAGNSPDLATFLLSDPPHILYEGLRHFRKMMAFKHAQWEHEQAQKRERDARRKM